MSVEMSEKAAEGGADWRKLHALGLPEGSIRAALALGIFGTIWALIVSRPERDVPDYLRDLLFIIMGHYFAARKRVSTTSAPAGPGALFLPRGTVRIVLFAGFAVVGFVLFREGRFARPLANPAVVTLMLVAGFLLGVLAARVGDVWTGRGHRLPRWVEDVKALLAIAAAVGLVFFTWNQVGPVALHVGAYGPEHLLGAVVGFYFGSRS